MITALRDPDVSIRRRALDLLFTMADNGSANEIVEELVKYLTVAGALALALAVVVLVLVAGVGRGLLVLVLRLRLETLQT